MKTTTTLTATLAAVALTVGFTPSIAYAGCGTCGGDEGHSHKTSAHEASSTVEKEKAPHGSSCTEATCGHGTEPASGKAYKTLDPAQLNALLEKDKDVIVLDARSGQYDDGRRIPGATQLDPDASAEEIAKIVPEKNATIVTYCSNVQCPASALLTKQLKKHGYTDVHKMPAGIEGWEEAGFPVVEEK